MTALADLDGREGVAPPKRAHDEEKHERQLGPQVEGNGLSGSKEKRSKRSASCLSLMVVLQISSPCLKSWLTLRRLAKSRRPSLRVEVRTCKHFTPFTTCNTQDRP